MVNDKSDRRLTIGTDRCSIHLESDKEDALSKPELYTTEDIQEIFKCGKRWAYELMRAPAFPSVKIGGKYIVERSALESWFKAYAGKEFIM